MHMWVFLFFNDILLQDNISWNNFIYQIIISDFHFFLLEAFIFNNKAMKASFFSFNKKSNGIKMITEEKTVPLVYQRKNKLI